MLAEKDFVEIALIRDVHEVGDSGRQGLVKKLPESPSPGMLDLTGILDSTFAFS